MVILRLLIGLVVPNNKKPTIEEDFYHKRTEYSEKCSKIVMTIAIKAMTETKNAQSIKARLLNMADGNNKKYQQLAIIELNFSFV